MSKRKAIKLEDFATLKYGKLPSKDISSGDYPIWSGYKYVGTTDTFNCPKDTPIVVARGVGGTGDVKIAKDNCFLTNLSISVSLNEKICNPHFFTYYFAKDNLRYLDSGSAQSQITIEALKKVVLKLPTLTEQKKIVGILSSLDEKIETNRKINARLEELAQAIFKSWLKKCNDNVLIRDIAQNILDYTPNPNPKVRLINSADVTEGLFEDYPLVDNNNLKGHFKKRFRKEDILYSEIRPRNHHYGYALMDGYEYIVSTRFMVIRNVPEKVTSAVLYQYLLLPEVEADFTAKTESRSGTFPQGTYKDIETIKVPYSTNQNTINLILSSIRYQQYYHNKESARLAELRDTLLPKLISSELIPE